jgi:2-polyprenyl-6-methoxyphenol hydroxylase-like FAD-dependent oxidoreductase
MSSGRMATGLYDVAVVGAGLAGSSFAAALAQRGWNVLLVERDRFPRHKVCGEFLSPEAQHSLHNLGVLPAVTALGPVELHGAALTAAGGAAIELPLAAPAWGVSRYVLDEALAAAAQRAGATIWQPAVVTAVERTAAGCTLQVRHADSAGRLQTASVAARAVVFACGRHSTAALPPRPQGSADKHGWRRCVGLKVHYSGVQMEPRVELYLFEGGYVGINPIEGPGDRANVCLLITYAAFQTYDRSLACILEATASRHRAFAARVGAARLLSETECAVAPVDTHRSSTPWDAALDAPCLGDTAAMIPPLAGDGMAMALRSAELCLEPADAYLRGELSPAAWEKAYTGSWHKEFRARLQLGRALQSALTTPLLGDVLAQSGRLLPHVAEWMLAGTRGRTA